MGRTFSVGVNEAQRRHAISANANFLIPEDYVPAVRLVFEDGDELAAVVQILEATRSRQSMLARAHDTRPRSKQGCWRRSLITCPRHGSRPPT